MQDQQYDEEEKTLARVATLLSDPQRSFAATLRAMMTTAHLGTIRCRDPGERPSGDLAGQDGGPQRDLRGRADRELLLPHHEHRKRHPH